LDRVAPASAGHALRRGRTASKATEPGVIAREERLLSPAGPEAPSAQPPNR
jgi:hypothetical protein